jgi:hypothetical protein
VVIGCRVADIVLVWMVLCIDGNWCAGINFGSVFYLGTRWFNSQGASYNVNMSIKIKENKNK